MPRPSLIVLCLLLTLFSAFAVTQHGRSFYPLLEVKTPSNAPAITLDFLLYSHPSRQDCETLNGSLARIVLERCPSCTITQSRCQNKLDQRQKALLSESPIDIPSGRMASGVVTFSSTAATLDNQDLPLLACQGSEHQSARTTSPIKCFAPGTPRPKSAVIGKPTPLPYLLLMLLVPLATAWFAVWMILKYEHLHAHLSHDHIDAGPQKYHEQPTPRIGGVAIMLGLIMMLAVPAINSVLNFLPLSPSAQETSTSLGLLILASLPAFLGGLVEDLTKKVGVMERLLLTMIAGSVAAWLLGATLERLDIPFLDGALAWLPFAVIFTAFAIAGIANAINIIDGYNGLASGYSIIALAALAYVAYQVGDTFILVASLGLAGALLGFLVWNWPGGKIFLGDGGAYMTGFMLAELSVLLAVRNTGISPWFPLTILIYPVFETLFSIYRRKFVRHQHPGHPDRLHLHQLVFHRVIRLVERKDRLKRNSLVALYYWVWALPMAFIAIEFQSNTQVLQLLSLAYCICYLWLYRQKIKWRVPSFLIIRRQTR